MKRNVMCLVWLGVPLLLAVGCADNRRDASVSYSPALTGSYAATSDRPVSRVYPNTSANIDVTTPPAGASSQDWTVAEEIRSLLTTDRNIGKAPMAAVVNHGVVTLRGSVRNQRERDRLRNEIASLPGVQRVDDQLDFKNSLGMGPGTAENY